jgi:glyoxylate/hydroxypyruvate reductase A
MTTQNIVPFISAAAQESTSEWVTALQEALPELTLISVTQLSLADRSRCTVAIVANPDPDVLKTFPNLVWVHSVWAGVERLVAELGPTKLKIVRMVDPALASTMAEAVLAWTLYLHRDMPAYRCQQRRGVWRQRAYVPAQEKTVGILGFGELGQAAAQRLLPSGFNVFAWSTTPSMLEGVTHFCGRDGLKQMLKKCNILVCLLPHTPKTAGLIDAELLACLPDSAALINFGRGPIINERDLRDALDCGRLDHAVLDVFNIEPLPEAHWEWNHPRVTILPHCSAPTNKQTAAKIVADRVRHYLMEGVVPSCVDVQKGY